MDEEDLQTAAVFTVVAATCVVTLAVTQTKQTIQLEEQGAAEHQHQQAQIPAHRRHYRYRIPLQVPLGPEFDLDNLSDVWCLEFLRYSTGIFILDI
jgi:hypothetical protein